MKECNLCGKCCINYSNGGLSASATEIELWRLFRPDIHEYVNNGEIWMSPDTGEQLVLCPWLIKNDTDGTYTCHIYNDRPDDCKYYPVTVEQMIKDDCEMLLPSDLDNPGKAQVQLDKLMSDSRPAYKQ